MRTKSEAKRQAILDVATAVFKEEGFAQASMSEICARVGGSKATLYNHFASKEELFFEVMFRSSAAAFEASLRTLEADIEDVAEALRGFGTRFLAVLYSPEVLAARRLVIAEAGRSELGRQCYVRGPALALAAIVQFLLGAMTAGKLRQADPLVAAQHLRALLEAEFIDGFLFQMVEALSAAQIGAAVDRAVAAFMAAYGPLARSPASQ